MNDKQQNGEKQEEELTQKDTIKKIDKRRN